MILLFVVMLRIISYSLYHCRFQLLLTKTLGYCVEAVGVANFFQYTTVLVYFILSSNL